MNYPKSEIQICFKKHQTFNIYGQQASANKTHTTLTLSELNGLEKGPKALACVRAWPLSMSVAGTGKKL